MTQAIGRTSTEERALKLLGQGHGPEIVATAVGVSVSRISQLLSDENFAVEVAELRFQNLQKHNETDSVYDTIEKKLVDKMQDLLPLMMRPMEVLKAIQVINAAKRRGQSAPESITHQNQVINLTIPTQVINKFKTNINNQVIQAGNQELITVQSGQLQKLADKLLRTSNAEAANVQTSKPIDGTTIETARDRSSTEVTANSNG